jgi:hypothetical protein
MLNSLLSGLLDRMQTAYGMALKTIMDFFMWGFVKAHVIQAS